MIIKLRKWNRNKTQVLLLLSISRGKPLSARVISLYTGIDLDWLRSRLSLWTKWQLVKRVLIRKRSQLVYGYFIACGGRKFLRNAESSYGRYRIDVPLHKKVLAERIQKVQGNKENRYWTLNEL